MLKIKNLTFRPKRTLKLSELKVGNIFTYLDDICNYYLVALNDKTYLSYYCITEDTSTIQTIVLNEESNIPVTIYDHIETILTSKTIGEL